MSFQPPQNQSRGVCYGKRLGHLAVANNNGDVTIRKDIDLVNLRQDDAETLSKVYKRLKTGLKTKEWIEVVLYSPNEKLLAIGSHDNNIYVFETPTYSKSHIYKKSSSYITCIDFDLDSKYIRSVDGSYELLFFDMKKKNQDPHGPSNTQKTMWADQTCKLGWNVQGIYPKGCDGSHINTCAMSKDQKMIATGDDYGFVSFYRNPCLEKHKGLHYMGHSEHVTTVKFAGDGKTVFSVGGQD